MTETTTSLLDDHMSNSMFDGNSIHNSIGCDDMFSTSCFDDTINSGVGGGCMFDVPEEIYSP